MLVFRPGRLTREYIMGKRAKYVAPVPLFLLVVFLMFFVFSFVKITDNIEGATDATGKPMTPAEARMELPRLEAELADIDRQIASSGKTPEPGELAGLRGARIGVVAARNRVRARAANEAGEPTDLKSEIVREITQGNPTINTGSNMLDKKVAKGLKNPELAIYKVQGKAYKFSFLLVPLSLPWLWLIFAWKRGVYLYDHAIFALYSISFMSLLFIVGSGAVTLGITSPWAWVPLVLAPFVHLYVQLKGVYGLRRCSALWRTVALTIGALLSISFFAAMILVLGVID